MKDTKFLLQFTALLSLIVVALYILDFVSFPKKDAKDKETKIFLTKLSEIDNGFDFVDFKKIIKPVKVVVIEKEIVKKIKVPVVVKSDTAEIVRDTVNKSIKPAKSTVIDITSEKIAQNSVEKKSEKVDIYSKLQQEFQKNHDYKTALKISRLYYTGKRYKDSLKWAMIANELNEKDDSSWILFAKTKLKLGDKKNAKKALLTYDRVYHSQRVKDLLGRISS